MSYSACLTTATMADLETIRVELSKFDYIRFSVSDLNGRNRGVIIPSRNAAKYLETGVDVFEGMLLFGYKSEVVVVQNDKNYHHGNMALVPDLDTFHCIPWGGENKYKIAEFLCEPKWKIDRSPQEASPRYLAGKQLARLDKMGFQLFSGFEVEYILLHADSLKPLYPGREYMCHRNQNKYGNLMFDFDAQLFESGVDLEKVHMEYSASMFEAVLKPKYGIEAVDGCANLKQGLMEMADNKDLKLTFMSRFYPDDNGAGMHFSFSLISKTTGENAFYDAKASDKLSATAKHWIAGIMKHSKALTALVNPTMNCYRRLHQPWAPGPSYWDIEDRESSLRAKNHGPSETYLENRIPGGMSNPYIVLAATVAAGLEGVANKLTCPERGRSPDCQHLPESLPEAMKCLKEDQEMVNALGEEFVSWYLACKDTDVKAFQHLSDDVARMEMERKYYL